MQLEFRDWRGKEAGGHNQRQGAQLGGLCESMVVSWQSSDEDRKVIKWIDLRRRVEESGFLTRGGGVIIYSEMEGKERTGF